MNDISFSLGKNDLVLVSDEDNLVGACKRRLGCLLDSPYIYDGYGSELETLIGLKKSDINLELIEQETVNTLLQDNRISSVSANADYTLDGVRIEINIVYNDGDELSFVYESNNEE